MLIHLKFFYNNQTFGTQASDFQLHSFWVFLFKAKILDIPKVICSKKDARRKQKSLESFIPLP